VQEEVLLFATDVESLILWYYVVWGAFEFVIAFCSYSGCKFFLEFVLGLADFVFHLLVVLISLLLVFYLQLQHRLAHLETCDRSILLISYAGLLLLMDDALYAFELLFDVGCELVHFEGGDGDGFTDALNSEFIEF
jgi:hypothetical protein